MARIAGIDLPGIGRSSAQQILTKAGISWDKKVQDWTDAEQKTIRDIIAKEYVIEGELRSEVQMNIKRLMDIGCYRGIRHRLGLPLRGVATEVFVTDWVCHCADSQPRTMHVPVKDVRRQLQVRKKQLSLIKHQF